MKLSTVIFLLILMACTGCDLSNSDDEPIPEIPGKLVYSAPDVNGRHQIYTSLTNGTKRKQLTQSGSEEAEFFNPSWSNDGTQIALTSTLKSSSNGLSLYIMNADGSDLRPLKERPNSHIVTPGENPVWSPDDSKIAFDWCTNCELGGNNFEIYAYDFKTDDITQLTDTLSLEFYPKWKNNEELYFISDRDYYFIDSLRTNEDIYIGKISSSSESRITETGEIGSLTLNRAINSILIRPESGDDDWYFLDTTTNDSTFFEFPSTISRTFTSAVTWSKNGEWILLRIAGLRDGRLFTFYNTETEVALQFNIEPLKDAGMDWYTE